MEYFFIGMEFLFSSFSEPFLLVPCAVLLLLILLLLLMRLIPLIKLHRSGELPTGIKPEGKMEQKVLRIRKRAKRILWTPLLILPLAMLLPTMVYVSDIERPSGLFNVLIGLALFGMILYFAVLFFPPWLQGLGRTFLRPFFRCPACRHRLELDEEYIQGFLYLKVSRFSGNEPFRKFELYLLSVGGIPAAPEKCPHCRARLIDPASECRRIAYYKKVRQSSPWHKSMV